MKIDVEQVSTLLDQVIIVAIWDNGKSVSDVCGFDYEPGSDIVKFTSKGNIEHTLNVIDVQFHTD